MEIWSSVVATFSSVPAVFWSATIALSGVLLVDWRNTQRAEQKNQFDAEQKALDRNLELRKQVYLPAAAAFADVQGALPVMIEDYPRAVIAMQALGNATAKVVVVSNIETAMQMQRCTSRITKSFLLLSKESAAGRELKIDLAFEENQIENLKTTLKQLQADMDVAARSGADHNDVYVMRDRIVQQNLRIGERLERCVNLTDGILRAQVRFGDLAMQEAMSMSADSLRLLGFLRHELGQDQHMEDFAKQSAKINKELYAELSEFMAEDSENSNPKSS